MDDTTELVAAGIREQVKYVTNDRQMDLIIKLVQSIAFKLKRSNPSFNFHQFALKCGVT